MLYDLKPGARSLDKLSLYFGVRVKTDRISVAKLRLGDFHKEERQRAAAQTAVARGKMTFADALQTYRERLKGDHSLKDRSKSYREE